ncbi:MAG: hypothetical protein ACJ76P_05340 [Actinomycetota bacterium]
MNTDYMAHLDQLEGRSRRLAHWLIGLTATAVVLILIASGYFALVTQQQNGVLGPIRQNGTITRAATDSIVCILAIAPEDRTSSNIRTCMSQHGYLRYFEGARP